MKIVLGKIKNLLATLLLCISFNANSAVILEITGDTNGVLNSNHHSIDASSATLNSNYGFYLDFLNKSVLSLEVTGYNSFFNSFGFYLEETDTGTENIADDGISHKLSFAKDAYIYDLVNSVTLYSGTLFAESEYFYNSNDGVSSFTIWFDDPSVTANAVPEPSVLALFALGLVGLGFARKKKQA